MLWGLVLFIISAYAQGPLGQVEIPLNESLSAPAIDLGVDPDLLSAEIQKGKDSSLLEPDTNDIYKGATPYVELPIPALKPNTHYVVMNEGWSTQQLFQVQVTPEGSGENESVIASFSLANHAALLRYAVLSKLGYRMAKPVWEKSISLRFDSEEAKIQFLDQLSDGTLTTRDRWVQSETKTTVTLQDVIIETRELYLPPVYWGIFTENFAQSRRSLRALALISAWLDIPERINLYSPEFGSVQNHVLKLQAPTLEVFQNELSVGDLRWILKKLQMLTLEDFKTLIIEAQYPKEFEHHLLQKILLRLNSIASVLLKNKEYKPYPTESFEKIVTAKVPGYASEFTYGDPKSPLRLSELARYFGIDAINNALGLAIDQGNRYLSVRDSGFYVEQHKERFMNRILEHIKNNPGQPYVQPTEIWGGPVGSAHVRMSRNIVSGTFYGSEFPVQLVNQIQASVQIGAFFGVSGIPKVGVSVTPTLSLTRAYTHVKPLSDVKTAWKTSWLDTLVPWKQFRLSSFLKQTKDEEQKEAIETFLSKLAIGEMFIITNGYSASTSINVGIPLGAILGFLPPFSMLSEEITTAGRYWISDRTVLIKTAKGFQAYRTDLSGKSFQLGGDTRLILSWFQKDFLTQKGSADSKAYIFPEEIAESNRGAFQRSIRQILRSNRDEILSKSFHPFDLDHEAHTTRNRNQLGPWVRTKRESIHEVRVTPPLDPEKRYEPKDHERTFLEGTTTRIRGRDFFGFVSSSLRTFIPYFRLGSSQVGDDPSSQIFGKSRSVSVHSEIETTPGRDATHTLRVQSFQSGWNLSKKNLSKWIRQFNEETALIERPLIDEAVFQDTRRIQSYQLGFTLLISEKGKDRLLKFLDSEVTSTRQALNYFLTFPKVREHQTKSCDDIGKPTDIYTLGPSIPVPEFDSVIESSRGVMSFIPCVSSDLKTLFDLRRQAQGLTRKLQHTSNPTQKNTSDLITAWNSLLVQLLDEVSLSSVLQWIGKDAFLIQAKINGFRTRDENGDRVYASSSIGELSDLWKYGPLSSIESTHGIQSHELYGRYLTDGF